MIGYELIEVKGGDSMSFRPKVDPSQVDPSLVNPAHSRSGPILEVVPTQYFYNLF